MSKTIQRKKIRGALVFVGAILLLISILLVAVFWPGIEASRIIHTETQRIDVLRATLAKPNDADYLKNKVRIKTIKSSFSTIDIHLPPSTDLNDVYRYGILYHSVPPEICVRLAQYSMPLFDAVIISTEPVDAGSKILIKNMRDAVINCNSSGSSDQLVGMLFLEK